MVAGTVAAVVASVVPLPERATRSLVLAAGASLLDDGSSPSTDITDRIGAAARKLAATAAQYGAAESFRRHHPLPADLATPDRIVRRLTTLRRTMVNQLEVTHPAGLAPALLSGMGWCDQLNGAAAVVLAAELGRVDLVALIDPVTGDGHSVARVWSASAREWLYFDLWSDRAVVFTVGPRGAFRVLASADVGSEQPFDAATRAKMARYWASAADGAVFTSFAPTLGGHLLLRARMALGSASAQPAQSPAAGPAASSSPPVIAARLPIGEPFAREFLTARLADLRGDTAAARVAYATAARRQPHDPSEPFVRAAGVLAHRLGALSMARRGDPSR